MFLQKPSFLAGKLKVSQYQALQALFQILNNHAPIVSTLVAGRIKIQGDLTLEKSVEDKFIKEGNYTYLEINSGAIELSDNKVILLTD